MRADFSDIIVPQATVYTDGSCPKPRGPGGWAYIAFVDGGANQLENADYFEQTTHQIAEMVAVLRALNEVPKGDLTIVSDSQYVVRGCSEWMPMWKELGWRKNTRGEIANLDLWKHLDEAIRRHASVTFKWVKGHSGDHWNEYVDKKAGEQTEIVKAKLARAAQGREF